ncbi:unnamed protein product [Prorocentrum cordatum]|uniref:Uncharacterized protein n=1 Tax=Prorocentrum cordatum TaxID=2364126 RepID=A0ABN9RRX4_9DINO|nr:unnamed protein product [Polarella glacialis]
MISNVRPGLTEDEVFNIVALRVAVEPEECAAEFLQVDEGAKLLSPEDEKEITKQQKTLSTDRESKATLVADMVDCKARRRAAAADAAGKGRGKGRGRGRGAGRGGPAPPPRSLDREALAMMEQSEAKVFMPPNSFLWKSRADATWHGRFSDFPTHNRSTSLWGEDALWIVISLCWRDWCWSTATSMADCPMTGLWAEPAA